MLFERYSMIERENRILLQKMAGIMRRECAGGVSESAPKSLNYAYRKREQQKIYAQNQKILKRLQTRKATYKASDWSKHWQQHETYLRNLQRGKLDSSRSTKNLSNIH
eukprot:TRINITY_DN12323_c0_g1_i1.p1 TRINITY_DN12323_c0_g1~~TRINITY_DN12323_c0_g1_i1.p1  ORF type:complete len:108 (-),score=12.22 TRINITY_DN12323_c0_g1_i1:55-378(-)